MTAVVGSCHRQAAPPDSGAGLDADLGADVRETFWCDTDSAPWSAAVSAIEQDVPCFAGTLRSDDGAPARWAASFFVGPGLGLVPMLTACDPGSDAIGAMERTAVEIAAAHGVPESCTYLRVPANEAGAHPGQDQGTRLLDLLLSPPDASPLEAARVQISFDGAGAVASVLELDPMTGSPGDAGPHAPPGLGAERFPCFAGLTLCARFYFVDPP